MLSRPKSASHLAPSEYELEASPRRGKVKLTNERGEPDSRDVRHTSRAEVWFWRVLTHAAAYFCLLDTSF